MYLSKITNNFKFKLNISLITLERRTKDKKGIALEEHIFFILIG